MHKAGFVNIIGHPNVGKSTLMNALVGERLSIITSKAQTTRHRILGIYNADDFQIIFSDTPGIIKPKYGMQESMMNFVKTSLIDADVLLWMLEVGETKKNNEDILEKVKSSKSKVVVLLNKIDLNDKIKVIEALQYWQKELPESDIVPISALKKKGTEQLFDLILDNVPEHPPYYAKDALTDKPERFFMSEIIREKILLNYNQEIPYSCEVVIEAFKEEEKIIRIRAEIYVNRNSQKPILIGKAGSKLKKVGTEARKDMEKFLGKKVFLELFVKVKENWRDDDKQLKGFGY